MPLKGFTCPSWVPTAGQQNAPSYCLGELTADAAGVRTPAGCPSPCVHPLVLNAIWEANHKNHHVGSYLSASMLSGALCARQTVYDRVYDYYEHPTKLWWPVRGTIIHSVIEHAAGGMDAYGWLQELRMAVSLVFPEYPSPVFGSDGKWYGDWDESLPLTILLGGTTDAYNPVLRQLADMKSMADTKVEMMATTGQLDPKWVVQLNIYRWMIANTRIPDDVREQYGLEGEWYPAPESLVIQGIGMMYVPRSGMPTEVKIKQKGDKYPKKAVFQVEEVPVWSLEETEAFIRKEALQWYKWLVLGVDPPVTTEKWLCKMCHHNQKLVAGGQCNPTA